MTTVEIQDQPNDRALTWDEVLAELTELEGSRVAVRVVERHAEGASETLVTVFRGRLGARRNDREPTLFWPVHASSEDEEDDLEATGIYVQRERFDAGVKRGEHSVVMLTQGPVIVNVRRLGYEC